MNRRGVLWYALGRALGLALLGLVIWRGLNLPAQASSPRQEASASPVVTPTPLPAESSPEPTSTSSPPEPSPEATSTSSPPEPTPEVTPASPPEEPAPEAAPPPADQEALREAARAAFSAQFPDLNFEPGLTRIAGDWAFVNFRVTPAEAGADSSWEVYLGLGRWDGAAWSVVVEGSSDFAAWLEQSPEELIPAEARPYLLPGQVKPAGAPGLWLPFPVGQTWRYIAGPNGGPRREAVDFGPFRFGETVAPVPPPTSPLTGFERDVTAAATGVVVDHDTHLVILRHGDYPVWETGYSSLAPDSNLAYPGQVVFQGQRLGAASPIGDATKGDHVHFWVRLNGTDQASQGQVLSEWQIYQDNSFLVGPNTGRIVYKTGLERIDCRTVERFRLAGERCHVKHFPVEPSPLPATLVSLLPVTVTVPPGGTGATLVQVDSPADLYRARLRLTFGPATLVRVVDAFPDQTGIQVAPGSVFNSFPQAIFLNDVRPAPINNGLIEFVAERQVPAPAFSGVGTLIEITWQRLAPGPVTVTLDEIELTDPNGRPLPVIITPTNFAEIQAGALLQGQVELQGRPDAGSVRVTTAGQQAEADAGGLFTVGATAAYTLAVTAPGYLSAWAEGQAAGVDGLVALGRVTLPGGDVTGDDRIDIFDLALLGGRYGSADAVADLTGDGTVNIFDLALAAANYGRQGPVTTWR